MTSVGHEARHTEWVFILELGPHGVCSVEGKSKTMSEGERGCREGGGRVGSCG